MAGSGTRNLNEQCQPNYRLDVIDTPTTTRNQDPDASFPPRLFEIEFRPL